MNVNGIEVIRTSSEDDGAKFAWAVFAWDRTKKQWRLARLTQFDELVSEAEETFESEGIPFRTVALEPLQEEENGDTDQVNSAGAKPSSGQPTRM